jgi:hypothetical protein
MLNAMNRPTEHRLGLRNNSEGSSGPFNHRLGLRGNQENQTKNTRGNLRNLFSSDK